MMRRLPKGLLTRLPFFTPSGSAVRPTTPGRTSMADRDFVLALRFEGCVNRPFFHVVVTKSTWPVRKSIDPIEQVGTYDPVPNRYGEKLLALNVERILHYLSQGAAVQDRTAELLGLAGLLPVHPDTYRNAWRNRREFRMERMKAELEAAEKGEDSQGVAAGEEGTKTTT